jgi:hypothetical protein
MGKFDECEFVFMMILFLWLLYGCQQLGRDPSNINYCENASFYIYYYKIWIVKNIEDKVDWNPPIIQHKFIQLGSCLTKKKTVDASPSTLLTHAFLNLPPRCHNSSFSFSHKDLTLISTNKHNSSWFNSFLLFIYS